MELMEALRTRRAVRSYTDEQIDNDLIRELIEAATLAPSAMNLQPWAFVVVNGSARLQGLSDEAKRYTIDNLPKGSPLAGHFADKEFKIFHDAPALIMICAKNEERQSDEDCCLAGQNLMLAAHAQGLGTCWIGLSRPWLNATSVKKELGIPPALRPVAPIIVGRVQKLLSATPRDEPLIIWGR
ncbi:nitroreductase family protein [Mesorhizobium sp. PAMC28654]|uniref:nitroreductase family protein n=1 Tax=Mesorhizobium sp. PAMC28654 TaxID=2880934 RepID=UPI001D09D21E|nr:nitroreductase family protein [Mesorhizobium sp. PAMC28654]UDL90731.1 nitroreductase family protein [Mesorhizobium sp. PAMC28654]